MSHDDAYWFFTVGRRLERADLAARVLDVQSSLLPDPTTSSPAFGELIWTSGLRSVERRPIIPATRGADYRRRRGHRLPALRSHVSQNHRSASILVEQLLTEIPGHEACRRGLRGDPQTRPELPTSHASRRDRHARIRRRGRSAPSAISMPPSTTPGSTRRPRRLTEPDRNDHQGRARTPHHLRLRSSGPARAPRRTAATGTTHSNPDRGLFAAGRAGRSLPQLAAGSVRQLPGRLVFPEPTKRFEVVVDLVADMTVVNPFDFFLNRNAEHVPFDYDLELAPRSRPLPATLPPTPVAAALGSRDIDARTEHEPSTSWSGSTSDWPTTSSTRSAWSPACRRRSRRSQIGIGSCRDSAWLLVQILRHLGLPPASFLATSCSSSPMSQPIEARRARGGLHRSPRLDRGLPPGRRLGRARPHLGTARRRGPHPAGRHAHALDRGRPISGDGRASRGGVRRSPTRSAHPRRRPGHQALRRGKWRAIDARSGCRSTSGWTAGDVRLTHGRRADLRVDRRQGGARVEDRRRRADKRASPTG